MSEPICLMQHPSSSSKRDDLQQSLPVWYRSNDGNNVRRQNGSQPQGQSDATEMNRWLCDVCQQKYFDDYEKACQHEAKCKGPSNTESGTKMMPKQETQAPTPPSRPSIIPTSEPSSQSTVEMKFEAASKASKKNRPAGDVPPKPSANQKNKKTKTNKISKAAPAKTGGAKDAKKPVDPFFAPRKAATKRPSPTSANTSSNKESTKQPAHDFFCSRAKKSKSTPQATSTSDRSGMEVENDEIVDTGTTSSPCNVDNHDDVQMVGNSSNSRPKQTSKKSKTSSSPVRTVTLEQASNNLASMINELTNGKSKSKPTQPESQAPLAGIFCNKDMKQLMAEQRQAEFQAQRRRERQKEQERQEKRAAAASGSTTNPGTSKLLTSNKAATVPPHCRLPLAPQFGIPSHVAPPYAAPVSEVDKSSHWITTTNNGRTDRVFKDEEHGTKHKLFSSPSDLDAVEDNRDLLQEAMAKLIAPPSFQNAQLDQTAANSSAQDLWSIKYGHAHNMLNLTGHTDVRAATTLQNWIHDWCSARQLSMDRMKQRQEQFSRRQKSNKKKKQRKVIYKEDSDDDDSDNLANVYLLTGPPASGKTELVHGVAKASNCSVLEINTTMVRSASALKHSIQEATQSCSTLDLFQKQQPSGPLHSMFQQQQEEALVDSDEEAEEEALFGRKSRRPQASLTIILIDEVDLIYETKGDAGFWTSLTSVAKTARCPILLTAQAVPPFMRSIRHSHLALKRPTPMECASKLYEVCLQERIRFQTSLGHDEIKKGLQWLATTGQCDLRKILLQLQLYHTATHQKSVTVATEALGSIITQTDNSSKPDQVIPRPLVQSVVPHRVPADKYSILTLHGTNFDSLLLKDAPARDWTVLVGSSMCRARIVDNGTILVLCPPLTNSGVVISADDRVVPIRLQSKVFGQCDGVVSAFAETLPDGSVLHGGKRLGVEYLLPENNDEDMHDSDEFEMDNRNANTTGTPATLADLPISVEGLQLWTKTLQEEDTSKFSEPASAHTPSQADHSLAKELSELALGAQRSSDAAYLEEFQFGCPYLSGACRGFGFDLTEEGGTVSGGKLRLNDNCRPPSEERLFALGWNDKCFFHGCPETYFTRPSTAQERRYLNNDMTTVRGEHLSSTGELAGAAADKEDENPIDWEETLRSDSNTTEEDMFLPQRLPILLQTLPQMLRSSKDWAMDLHGWTANKLLDERRQETSARLQSWLSALFGQTLQSTKTKARTTSRELLQLDGDLDAVATTQFLPTLRRIGALEESSEALERANGDETVVSSRRLTRRKTRDVRRHYLDNISRKLEWDEAEMSTAEMGRTMANSLLSYQGAAGAAAPCSR